MKKIIFWAIYNIKSADICEKIFETREMARQELFDTLNFVSAPDRHPNSKPLSKKLTQILKENRKMTMRNYKVVKIEGRIIFR